MRLIRIIIVLILGVTQVKRESPEKRGVDQATPVQYPVFRCILVVAVLNILVMANAIDQLDGCLLRFDL